MTAMTRKTLSACSGKREIIQWLEIQDATWYYKKQANDFSLFEKK